MIGTDHRHASPPWIMYSGATVHQSYIACHRTTSFVFANGIY